MPSICTSTRLSLGTSDVDVTMNPAPLAVSARKPVPRPSDDNTPTTPFRMRVTAESRANPPVGVAGAAAGVESDDRRGHGHRRRNGSVGLRPGAVHGNWRGDRDRFGRRRLRISWSEDERRSSNGDDRAANDQWKAALRLALRGRDGHRERRLVAVRATRPGGGAHGARRRIRRARETRAGTRQNGDGLGRAARPTARPRRRNPPRTTRHQQRSRRMAYSCRRRS